MSLVDLLRRPGDSGSPAIIFEDVTISRSALERQISDVAALLRNSGVDRGTKVLIALPNSPAFLVTFLAVSACDAVFMPINPGLAPEERHRIDEIARPDVVIAGTGSVELMPGAWLSRPDCVPY